MSNAPNTIIYVRSPAEVFKNKTFVIMTATKSATSKVR